MATIRGQYQGTWNVIRFNWHFYIWSVIAIAILLSIKSLLPSFIQWVSVVFVVGIIVTTLISLIVTYYIYDHSSLYDFDWLDAMNDDQLVVNINAGFDETSTIIKEKIGKAQIEVLDFYDSELHTEVSIKRARKAYPPYPNTIKVSTDNIPLIDGSVDMVIAFLSAHEIRDKKEQTTFLLELKRKLKPSGKLIIVEHIRDLPNFLAYNIGFLHFHSKKTWFENFTASDWEVVEKKITPFISKFTLRDGGTT